MRLCRFVRDGSISIGAVTASDEVVDLSAAGVEDLHAILAASNPADELRRLAASSSLPRMPRSVVRLAAPVDRQEVWAAGVTYLRSKTARMEESDFSATAYDKVYDATRPELFFKSAPQKVVASGETVGIRRDATWNVPEPELALVLNTRGEVAGYTIGNDMSSRDIEGENLLYLPQAKVYDRSCALGPWIVLGDPESAVRHWTIGIAIGRRGTTVFEGTTTVNNIKRTFADLADYLFRCQRFPHGAVLLTGTGIVPPDNFTLGAGDTIDIHISGIGHLNNTVEVV
jgi:2-dehydro-3-deoxy-D-arabinonate dehydratase